MSIVRNFKLFVTKLLLILLILALPGMDFGASVLKLSQLSEVAEVKAATSNKIDYLDVVDTLLGMNTYYILDESLNLDKVKLVLVNPDSSLKTFDKVKKLGNIDAKDLNKEGTYTLVLGYKVGAKYAVLEKSNFTVSKSKLNLAEFGIGGDTLKLGDTVKLMSEDRFEFVNPVSDVPTFGNFSLTVRALNQSGQLDSSYTGTIVFESSDANAILPADYTFSPADAGQKVFNNAFTLANLGQSTISVKDKNSNNLMGEVTLNVVAQVNQSEAEGVLVVDSPTSGTVTNNRLVFVGTADPGLEVQLLDAGVFLAKTNADAQGKFSLTTSPLADGDYTFTLKTSNAVSQAIVIKINSEGAKVKEVKLNPQVVVAASNTEITVSFESEVSAASAIINGVRVPLVALDVNKLSFRGQFVAPGEPNSYPINIDVTNTLGVRSELENVSQFNVVLGSAADLNMNITFNVPSQVVGLQASSEDQRVVLNWEAANALKGISFYKILYGTSAENLNLSVDTNSNATTWFIPNLENQVRYYFQVYGVDVDGNTSDQGSQIISVVPGVSGSTTLHGSALTVDSTAETGPELIFVLLFSLLAGAFVSRRKLV